ncbi:MAG: ammonium transporter [bacterium]
MNKKKCIIAGSLLTVILGAGQAQALEVGRQLADLRVTADTIWVIICAALVFFMNTGFALLEAGLCRSKNAVNILSKNVIVFGVAALAYWAVGFALMFGNGSSLIGGSGWFLKGLDNSPAIGNAYRGVFSSLNWTGIPLNAKFLFQMVFAATAATIVSGAVAERIKYYSFIVFSLLLVAFIYPVSGHWIWGGGWLQNRGFSDFAGSLAVHSVGGWAALTGAVILGPRLGKYGKDGRIKPILGHNQGFTTLGMFILWLGWFGFNGGSTMAADAGAISRIVINTNMAACAGLVASTIISVIAIGKPDLSMALNGTLAGLVAITAGCDGTSITGSIIIGLIAGVLVVYSVFFFDKIKVDDPVGALSVHLVNGTWGVLAVGLFNTREGLLYGGGAGKLGVQALGVVAVGVTVVILSTLMWFAVKSLMGLRVTEEEEYEGLDVGEHGMEAYPDFLVSKNA